MSETILFNRYDMSAVEGVSFSDLFHPGHGEARLADVLVRFNRAAGQNDDDKADDILFDAYANKLTFPAEIEFKSGSPVAVVGTLKGNAVVLEFHEHDRGASITQTVTLSFRDGNYHPNQGEDVGFKVP